MSRNVAGGSQSFHEISANIFMVVLHDKRLHDVGHLDE